MFYNKFAVKFHWLEKSPVVKVRKLEVVAGRRKRESVCVGNKRYYGLPLNIFNSQGFVGLGFWYLRIGWTNLRNRIVVSHILYHMKITLENHVRGS